MFRKIIPAIVNPPVTSESEFRVSLSGIWNARIDPDDIGLAQKWYENRYSVMERVTVPGTVQTCGLGNGETDVQKEFAIKIRPFRSVYCGTAWFCRVFSVPENFRGKRIWLLFGGVAPTPEIWVNGVRIGDNHEPLAPFGFDITEALTDGENYLAVRITEEDRLIMMNYWYDGKWTGFFRDVELYATGESYIDFFSAVPDLNRKAVELTCRVGDPVPGIRAEFRIFSPEGELLRTKAVSAGDGLAKTSVRLSEVSPWSPDDPVLYRVEVILGRRGKVSDARASRFGFVKFSSEDRHFKINGEPYYFRAGGDFGTFPETGYPNPDREHWRKCLAQLRRYGYNSIRCQSHVPTAEYFDAADEVGLIVQSEMGVGGPIHGHSNYHTYSQWPKPTPDYREALRSQWNHIVERDVNHPSANIYAMGNELGHGGHILYRDISWRCYYETKAIKKTALVLWTDGSGIGKFEENMPNDFINGDARLAATEDRAVIQHEFRWWSSSPEVKDIPKYDGLPVRPVGELLAVEATAAHGISHILEKMGQNSRKLQYLEAKCKLEKLRRDYPNLSGVSHFNATDIAVSKQGILDEFYDMKYATPEMWQQVNGDTVVLNSLDFYDRCYAFGDTFTCRFFVSDFSHPSYRSPSISWRVTVKDTVIAEGKLSYGHTPFITVPAGEISFEIPDLGSPVDALLSAVLEEDGRRVCNSWRLWFFPKVNAPAENTAKVRTVEFLDEETFDFAKKGGSVLVKARSHGFVRPFKDCLGLSKGKYFFTKPASFFPFEELQDGSIIKDHPCFGDFPHEDYADMQFFNMISDSPPIDLEPLGLNDDDPVIRMIHCYIISRSLGTLVERSYGEAGGRILLCSIDLDGEWVEAKYLKSQIYKYLNSKRKPECARLSDHAKEMLLSASALRPAEEMKLIK
ncbi:MAG: hypothetical protein J5592_03880 [Clostridia bacterium]|nr:hypothetical protein [Clostridia bacterium]